MRRLATEADVSMATPYNVFGGKTGVFVAMFDAFLDRLPRRPVEGSQLNEIDRLLAVAESVADLWGEPSGTFCRLIYAIQSTGEMPSQLADRPKRELTRAMERLREAGWLDSEARPEVIAGRIAYANAGLFQTWRRGGLSKEWLIAELQLNALLPVLACASDRRRQEISEIVDRLVQELGFQIRR